MRYFILFNLLVSINVFGQGVLTSNTPNPLTCNTITFNAWTDVGCKCNTQGSGGGSCDMWDQCVLLNTGVGNWSLFLASDLVNPIQTTGYVPNFPTSYQVSNLPAGNYVIKLDHIDVLCDITGPYTDCVNNYPASNTICWCIDQDHLQLAFTVSPSFTVNVTKTDVSCFGGSDGTATITTANGGTAPFTYTWTPFVSSANTANSLAAGSYKCVVADVNGCKDSITFQITEPSEIVLTPTSSNSTCNNSDGSADVAVAGGTPGYNYTWSNGANTSSITNIPAGNYSVTVTDAKSCNKTQSFTITNNSNIITTNSSTKNVSCFAGNDGEINFSVTGGVSPYTYTWTPALPNSSQVTNLTAGNYSCEVEDASGCKKVFGFNLTEPPEISYTTTITPATCTGSTGGINVSVAGGTSPYTYSWNTGFNNFNLQNIPTGNYSLTITDANTCTKLLPVYVPNNNNIYFMLANIKRVSCYAGNDGEIDLQVNNASNPVYTWSNGATTSSLNNLSAGMYTCSITDANGCQKDTTLEITQPNPIVFNGESFPSNCKNNDGSATLNVSGGTPGYNYDWSNGTTQANLSNVDSGNYSLTITDQNGCLVDTILTISSVSSIQLSAILTNISCFGGNDGEIELGVANGNAPFVFNWSNGQTGNPLINLVANTYSVTLTDAFGCIVDSSFILTEPNAINLSEVNQPATCSSNDGSIEITVNGGIAPYTYQWSNGSNANPLNMVDSGNYSVTITDANNCQETSSVTLVSQANDLAFEQISAQQISCFGFADGILEISGKNGTPPYQYSWNTGSNTSLIQSLAVGSYTCIITDAKGCTDVYSQQIAEPNPLYIHTVTEDATCDKANGSLTITAQEGTPPYQYFINNKQVANIVDTLFPGSYNAKVVDANLCSNTEVFQIGNIETAEASFTMDLKDVYAPATVYFNNTSLHTDSVFWFLEDGYNSTVASFSHIFENDGNYTITLSYLDKNGCYDAITKEILIKPKPSIWLPNSFTPDQDELNDVFIPIITNIKQIEFSIYDRWGEKIFTTNELNQGWDGKLKGKDCPMAVYQYKLEAYGEDNTPFLMQGHVTLVR